MAGCPRLVVVVSQVTLKVRSVGEMPKLWASAVPAVANIASRIPSTNPRLIMVHLRALKIRRRGPTVPGRPGIQSRTPDIPTQMKTLGWILAALLLVVIVLVPLVASRAQRWPDCKGRVVMLKNAHGEPIECVCVAGSLSTSVTPGP